MKLLISALIFNSVTIVLSSPLPQARPWARPVINDMTPYECSRKCLRLHSDKYDVENVSRVDYCDKRSSEALDWFVDYIDPCWTQECGDDPEVTKTLVSTGNAWYRGFCGYDPQDM